MRHVPRALAAQLRRAARAFPALIVTGPRRAGKTTLLRGTFPRAAHHLLEDPDTVARVRADPRSFIEEIRTPAILDEIQNVPELLNYIRTRIDAMPCSGSSWSMHVHEFATSQIQACSSSSVSARATVTSRMIFRASRSEPTSCRHHSMLTLIV